jgi:hypothetical protein
MSINLVQWEGSTVTPKLDAIMYDDGSYGIIKGCAITHQGTNLLKIANGFIKIAGRLIEIAEETIQCQVSASGTVNGQLWIRLDLSSVTPAVFMTEAAAVLTPLTQNADCNFQNGIYELQLATYNIDESVITNLVETAPELERLRTALENIDLAANKVTYDNTHSGLSANKVQGAIDEINDNLTASNQTAGVSDVPFRFGCTDDGKFGYIINQGGADSVIPFNAKEEIEVIYSKITADNASLNETITLTDGGKYIVVALSYAQSSGGSSSNNITTTATVIFNSDYKILNQTKGRILFLDGSNGDTITITHNAVGFGRGSFAIYKVSDLPKTSDIIVADVGFRNDDGAVVTQSLSANTRYLVIANEISINYSNVTVTYGDNHFADINESSHKINVDTGAYSRQYCGYMTFDVNTTVAINGQGPQNSAMYLVASF